MSESPDPPFGPIVRLSPWVEYGPECKSEG